MCLTKLRHWSMFMPNSFSYSEHSILLLLTAISSKTFQTTSSRFIDKELLPLQFICNDYLTMLQKNKTNHPNQQTIFFSDIFSYFFSLNAYADNTGWCLSTFHLHHKEWPFPLPLLYWVHTYRTSCRPPESLP